MTRSMFIFLFAEGERAEAIGRVVGFFVGFWIMMMIGIVLGLKLRKKAQKKKEEEEMSRGNVPPNPAHK